MQKDKLIFIITAITVTLLLTAQYYIKKVKTIEIPKTEMSGEINRPVTNTFGRLTAQEDCYVIIIGSFNNEEYAKKDVINMKEKGIVNSGYFYRPDYYSTSSDNFFSTFIGPYKNIEECKSDLISLIQEYKYAYGLRISQTLPYLKFRK